MGEPLLWYHQDGTPCPAPTAHSDYAYPGAPFVCSQHARFLTVEPTPPSREEWERRLYGLAYEQVAPLIERERAAAAARVVEAVEALPGMVHADVDEEIDTFLWRSDVLRAARGETT